MLSDNLTVCIFCYNEEKRIEQTIQNFIGKFKILVVDNIPPSSDKTIEICKKYDVEYINIDRHGFSLNPKTMNELWSHVNTDYILYASCSEYVPDQLLELYANISQYNKYSVVRVARVSISSGRFISTWGDPRTAIFRGLIIRFSKRNSIDYNNTIIHKQERIICNKSEVLDLPRNINLMTYQFRDHDASWSDKQHAGYADIEATQMYYLKVKYNPFIMFGKSVIFFLRDYIYNGAFMQGHLGFMNCYYRFHLSMGIYLRLWDIENNMQKSQIEEINKNIREKLLNEEISINKLFR
jgi:glycosyltransferase involved in cell wall biosynthesis